MAKRVLVTQPIPEKGLARLRSFCDEVLVNPQDRILSEEELREMAWEKEGLLTMLTNTISRDLLESCPTIKAISNYAVGYNNIQVPECTRRGVGVANTPGVLTNATAEATWGLIFACARRIVESDQFLRQGSWQGWSPTQFLGVDIAGKTLGLLGAGRIGERVAMMARGFDMQVLYYARRHNPTMERELGARLVPMEDLLSDSDFISIHTPLTPETYHLIGESQLRRMKSTAILVNTARGAIIDEKALLEALRKKTILAAGLDVYEFEPRITEGLLALSNLVCLPHIASATVETRDRMALIAADNLIAMLQGERPAYPVNPQLWE